MQEGVVCDCTGGGVDAEQPPHINDPVRGNSLHQAKKEYLLLKSCIKENKQCRKNCGSKKLNLENDIGLIWEVDGDVNGHREHW